MKTKQYFSDEYLESCRGMKAAHVIDYLNNFMEIHTQKEDPTKLISLKIKQSLLEKFKDKAQTQGVKYQTQIKMLMEEWLSKGVKKNRT